MSISFHLEEVFHDLQEMNIQSRL